MNSVHSCLSCSRLSEKLERHDEIIVQLLRIVAATNEKVKEMEKHMPSNPPTSSEKRFTPPSITYFESK